MKEETKDLAIIPAKDELQKQLNKAIRAIDNKLKLLGVDTNYIYKNAIQFKLNTNDGNGIYIQSVTDLNYLATALGRMQTLSTEIKNAYNSVDISTYPVPTYLGASIDNWILDISYRLKLASNSIAISNLNAKKAELSNHLSAEQRLFETLKSTADLLK